MDDVRNECGQVYSPRVFIRLLVDGEEALLTASRRRRIGVPSNRKRNSAVVVVSLPVARWGGKRRKMRHETRRRGRGLPVRGRLGAAAFLLGGTWTC